MTLIKDMAAAVEPADLDSLLYLTEPNAESPTGFADRKFTLSKLKQAIARLGAWDMTGQLGPASLDASSLIGMTAADDGAGGYDFDITGPLLDGGGSWFAGARSTIIDNAGIGSAQVAWPDIAAGDNLAGVTTVVTPADWSLSKTLAVFGGGGVAGDYAVTIQAQGTSVMAVAIVDGAMQPIGSPSDPGLAAGNALRFIYDLDAGTYSYQKNADAVVGIGTQLLAGLPAQLRVWTGFIFTADTPVLLGSNPDPIDPVNQTINATFAPATQPFQSVGDAALPAGAQDGDRYRVTAPGTFAGNETITGDVAEITSAATDIIVTRAGLTEAAILALVQNDLDALDADGRFLTAWQMVQINRQLLGVFNAPTELNNPNPATGTAVIAGSNLSGGWELIPNIAEGWIIFWDGAEWRGAVAWPGTRWSITAGAFMGVSASQDFVYAQARVAFFTGHNTAPHYVSSLGAPPDGWDWVSGSGRSGPTTVPEDTVGPVSVDLSTLTLDAEISIDGDGVIALLDAGVGVAREGAGGRIRLRNITAASGVNKITLATDSGGSSNSRLMGDGLDAMGNLFLRPGEVATINWSVTNNQPRVSVAGIARAVRGSNAVESDRDGSVAVTAAANVIVRGNNIRAIEIKGNNGGAAVNVELDFVPAFSGPIDVKSEFALANVTWSSPDGAQVFALPSSLPAGNIRIRNTASSGATVAGAWAEW